MRIRFTRTHGGNRLTCTRRDGSFTQGDVGPSLPAHDLAHYVVEQELRLDQGFFGLIAEGRTITELGDRTVIRTLPREALVAEVVTRTLQGLHNGAVAQSDFITAVEAELGQRPKGLDEAAIDRMHAAYITFLNAWESVAEGASLELRWR
jgi:hypothetical protein